MRVMDNIYLAITMLRESFVIFLSSSPSVSSYLFYLKGGIYEYIIYTTIYIIYTTLYIIYTTIYNVYNYIYIVYTTIYIIYTTLYIIYTTIYLIYTATYIIYTTTYIIYTTMYIIYTTIYTIYTTISIIHTTIRCEQLVVHADTVTYTQQIHIHNHGALSSRIAVYIHNIRNDMYDMYSTGRLMGPGDVDVLRGEGGVVNAFRLYSKWRTSAPEGDEWSHNLMVPMATKRESSAGCL